MRITYAKLKDGETWGVRIQDGQVAEGQRVQVWTKAGKAVEETILKIVYAGDGYQICQVVPKPRRGQGGARRQAPAPQCCPHCGKNLQAPVQAPQQPTRAVGQWQQPPRPQAPQQRPFQPPQGFTPPPPPEEPPRRWHPGYAAY